MTEKQNFRVNADVKVLNRIGPDLAFLAGCRISVRIPGIWPDNPALPDIRPNPSYKLQKKDSPKILLLLYLERGGGAWKSDKVDSVFPHMVTVAPFCSLAIQKRHFAIKRNPKFKFLIEQ